MFQILIRKSRKIVIASHFNRRQKGSIRMPTVPNDQREEAHVQSDQIRQTLLIDIEQYDGRGKGK